MDADGNHVLDANGNPISTTTDASGNYSFIDLAPGVYGVQEIQPGGFVSVGDTPGMVNGIQDGQVIDVDNLGSINLGYGDNSVGNNFTETKYATLSGYVYVDANNDGVYERGDGNTDRRRPAHLARRQRQSGAQRRRRSNRCDDR